MPPSLRVSVGVPPRYRHRLAQIDRQRDDLPVLRSPVPLVMPVPERHDRGYRRRRGVDLQGAGRIVVGRAGQIGGIAGAVLDGRAVQIDAVTARSAVFWPAATV